MVQLCGMDFARRAGFWAGVVDYVRPNPRLNRAGHTAAISTDWSYDPYHLPPVNAMINVTQVVFLSVCR